MKNRRWKNFYVVHKQQFHPHFDFYIPILFHTVSFIRSLFKGIKDILLLPGHLIGLLVKSLNSVACNNAYDPAGVVLCNNAQWTAWHGINTVWVLGVLG